MHAIIRGPHDPLYLTMLFCTDLMWSMQKKNFSDRLCHDRDPTMFSQALCGPRSNIFFLPVALCPLTRLQQNNYFSGTTQSPGKLSRDYSEWPGSLGKALLRP